MLTDPNLEADLSFEPKARVDAHCHSAFSKDALGSLDELAAEAAGKGLDAVCLTEHDSCAHRVAVDAWNAAHPKAGVQFFVGHEVSAKGGHVLVFGTEERIPWGKTLDRTLDLVANAGGVAVPAHPFRRGSGVGPAALAAAGRGLAAIEVWNAQERTGGNDRGAAWARHHGLGGTGGSDAHQVHDVGNGYTVCPKPVRSLDDFMAQVRRGETWGVGRLTARKTLLRQATRNTVRRLSPLFWQKPPE